MPHLPTTFVFFISLKTFRGMLHSSFFFFYREWGTICQSALYGGLFRFEFFVCHEIQIIQNDSFSCAFRIVGAEDEDSFAIE